MTDEEKWARYYEVHPPPRPIPPVIEDWCSRCHGTAQVRAGFVEWGPGPWGPAHGRSVSSPCPDCDGTGLAK